MYRALLIVLGLNAGVLPALAQSPAEWDKTVAEAKKEGSVNFYTGLPGNATTKQNQRRIREEIRHPRQCP